MKRALVNIIKNALTYGLRARVSLAVVGHELVIDVEDDGPGISDSEIETVFQPFRRLDSGQARCAEGVGLGLSIAQTIVEEQGGTVVLSNRPQGGLLVRIRLPKDRRPAKKPSIKLSVR